MGSGSGGVLGVGLPWVFVCGAGVLVGLDDTILRQRKTIFYTK